MTRRHIGRAVGGRYASSSAPAEELDSELAGELLIAAEFPKELTELAAEPAAELAAELDSIARAVK